jgi:GT2 family glycosyltransferase
VSLFSKWFGRRPERPGVLEALVVEPGRPLADKELPRASIVVLNLNGRHHLEPCFESLAALDYPKDKLEVILVDNGSGDGSADLMREKMAWVRLLRNDRNVGFAAGSNQGARAARAADVFVFLNNDMRVEKTWLRELVAPITRKECQATTSKILSWDGKKLNSAGGGMNFVGIGIQYGYLEDPAPAYDVPRKTLFACGGAMAIDARVFEDVGGFDEEFFAYYEDVDLGWRMWVEGHACHYVPTSVCYHHHSSTSSKVPREMIRLLQVRNPLLACVKNYDDANLSRVLGPALALSMRRMWRASGLHEEEEAFRIESAPSSDLGAQPGIFERARRKLDDHVPVKKAAAADLIGINDLLGNWEHWMARRAEVQGKRRRQDAEIFELFLKPRWGVDTDPVYLDLQSGLMEFLGLEASFPPDSIPEPKR